MNKKLTIFFDVQELYYLPQYLPVFKQLQKDNIFESKFIFHNGKFDDVINKIIADECLPATWVKDCLLYTSPSPRDVEESRMPSSA